MSDCNGDCCDCCHYGGHENIPKLQAENKRLREDVVKIDIIAVKAQNTMIRYKKALKDIAKHMEFSAGDGYKFSSVWNIAKSALEGK